MTTPARPRTMPNHITADDRSPRIGPATVATSRGCKAAIRAAVPPPTPWLTPSKMKIR